MFAGFIYRVNSRQFSLKEVTDYLLQSLLVVTFIIIVFNISNKMSNQPPPRPPPKMEKMFSFSFFNLLRLQCHHLKLKLKDWIGFLCTIVQAGN